MKYLSVVAMLLSFVFMTGCAPSGEGECEKKLAEAERRIAELEGKLRESAEPPTKAEPGEGATAEELAKCRSRLEKCEKDPFTGGKYLSEEQSN